MIHIAYLTDGRGRRTQVRPYRVLRCVNPCCARAGLTHVALLVSDGEGSLVLEDPGRAKCAECLMPLQGEAGEE